MSKDDPLIEILLRDAHRFDVFQAVRVLERWAARHGRKPVGDDAQPLEEAVRFKSAVTTAFPPTAIRQLRAAAKPTADTEPPADDGGARGEIAKAATAAGLADRKEPPPDMTVSFMGLVGPSSALPQHFTDQLVRVLRERNTALRDFLDLFHHRTISLFVRSWEKYRLPAAYERGGPGGEDTISRSLYSLIGFGTGRLRGRLSVDDEALLHYAGHFAHQPRSAIALEMLLSDYFERPVRVWQYQGRWINLASDEHSALPTSENPEGSFCQLGVNAVAGDRVWDVQSSFRIRLGPLTLDEFSRFMPEGEELRRLADLTRLFVGPGFSFDVQLVLKKEEVPDCVMASEGPTAPRLGLNTWAKSEPLKHDPEDAIFNLDND